MDYVGSGQDLLATLCLLVAGFRWICWKWKAAIALCLLAAGIRGFLIASTVVLGSLTVFGEILQLEIANMNVFGFILVGGALLLYVCLLGPAIVSAKRRALAATSAFIGFGIGVGLIALVASLCFVALVWRADVHDDVGRSIIAAIVTFAAALPAMVMGLVGSLVGALRGGVAATGSTRAGGKLEGPRYRGRAASGCGPGN